MASDSENMEKLLQAFAKKRREEAGAEFEMDPATRRLLHEEISRRWVSSGTERPSVIGWLASFWPRLAFGSGLALILAATAYVWMSNPSDELDATRNDESRKFALLSEPAPPEIALPDAHPEFEEESLRKTKTAPMAASPLRQMESELAFDQARLAENLAPSDPARDRLALRRSPPEMESHYGAGAIQPPDLSGPATIARSFRESEAAASSRAQPEGFYRSEAPPQAGRDAAAYGGALSGGGFGGGGRGLGDEGSTAEEQLLRQRQTLRFVQTPSHDSSPGQSSILSSFAVEREGDQIRIIDADGSVYHGQVVAPSATAFRSRTGREPESAASQNVSLIAVGTNRTSRHSVEVRGEIIANSPPGRPVTVQRFNIPTQPPSGPTPPQARSLGLRSDLPSQPGFRGQVRIGSTNQIQMEAVPAPAR